jgi:hypothetical protein
MSKHWIQLALLMLLVPIALAKPCQAATGFVRASFGKAGLIVGAGAGRGVLTYDGHDYRFRISGLSLGFAAGLPSLELRGGPQICIERATLLVPTPPLALVPLGPAASS